MSVRLRRLQSDYESVRRLVRLHPHIEIDGVSGNPPERYNFVLNVRSRREKNGEVTEAYTHKLEVTLPHSYPRDAPVFRMLTPVFHPNIAPHAVCIGDHWSAAESLDVLVMRVGEMLAYQSYNIKSPLNGKAAQWVEENQSQVPTDNNEFFVDLQSMPEPTDTAGTQCNNCGAASANRQACSKGHQLCLDCCFACPQCQKLVCLACGESGCLACATGCANCKNIATPSFECEQAHTLCGECAMSCAVCSKVLCLVCGTYPCPTCVPAATV